MIKRGAIVSGIVSLVAVIAVLAAPHGALAASCPSVGCLPSPNDVGVPTVSFGSGAARIVNIMGLVAGTLSVFFLTMGGIRYITSSGDPGRIASAKNTLLYAVIGLIVSIIAPALIGFVIAQT